MKFSPERIAQLKREIAAREITLGRRNISSDTTKPREKFEADDPYRQRLYPRNGGYN